MSQPASLAPLIDSVLARDLEELGDRLSALVNAFARHHPGFDLTSLTVDYVVRQDGGKREYLVDLEIRL